MNHGPLTPRERETLESWGALQHLEDKHNKGHYDLEIDVVRNYVYGKLNPTTYSQAAAEECELLEATLSADALFNKFCRSNAWIHESTRSVVTNLAARYLVYDSKH